MENTGNENFSQDLKDNEENRLSLHAVGQKKAYRLALFAMLAFSIVIVCVFSLAFVPPQFYQSVINSGSEEPSTAGRFVTQIASATNEIQQGKNWGISAVSYTHLTLPTIYSV